MDQDTTIDIPPTPGEDYTVIGDATLTLNTGIIGEVYLEDNAKLVVNGAELRSRTYVQGDNDITLLSGKYKSDANIVGGGDANIYIADGFELFNKLIFTGGTQHVEVHGFHGYAAQIIGNDANLTADLYADDPFYMFNSTGLFAGSFCWEESCSTLAMRGVDWRLHDNQPTVEGDIDGDGLVDLADLNLVRNNFGATLGYGMGVTPGDSYPKDGDVDLEDLNRVRNNFGSAAAVPEPPSLGMGVLAAAFLWTLHCLLGVE